MTAWQVRLFEELPGKSLSPLKNGSRITFAAQTTELCNNELWTPKWNCSSLTLREKLRLLHWLPIETRIHFKIVVLTFASITSALSISVICFISALFPALSDLSSSCSFVSSLWGTELSLALLLTSFSLRKYRFPLFKSQLRTYLFKRASSL